MVLNNIQNFKFDFNHLEDWVAGVIQQIAAKKSEARRYLDGLDYNLLPFIGLVTRAFVGPSGEKAISLGSVGQNKKRDALFMIQNSLKRLLLEET